ncbi:hypothetical protein BCR32DRAFT_282593 [Anaeromyces robustus]|uniref:Uncharacterized protein n=1 Tax=Anaeromyces robustus TaxID=1754192 RepID=A0A1Y1WX62_9FUNG|nr:hypothetical protein BCR32DRAFT_282593 [Anaeromyces robustus]|eukprot:ORX78131.1 hypothetical protein BCR32DRAFT_282593 [Anaeromyces robustus]
MEEYFFLRFKQTLNDSRTDKKIAFIKKLIARICKMLEAKSLFINKESYSLEIVPNVDMALMVGLTIIFDEFKHDDSE